MIAKRFATALVAVFLTGLSACGGPPPVYTAATAVGFPKMYQWTEKSVLEYGWVSAPLQRTEPTYCYSTLARPMCDS